MPALPPIPPPPATAPATAGAAPAGGYPASAPDLGRIQDAMRAALAALPPHVLRQAWRREGVQWGWDYLKAWVRGLRRADLELHTGRLDVRFVTEGAGGPFEYAFSVRLGGRAGVAPGPPGAAGGVGGCPT